MICWVDALAGSKLPPTISPVSSTAIAKKAVRRRWFFANRQENETSMGLKTLAAASAHWPRKPTGGKRDGYPVDRTNYVENHVGKMDGMSGLSRNASSKLSGDGWQR